MSGGTDNHLFLLNLVSKGLTGKEADYALGKANITVNKNAVPNDPKSPFVTSGIRIGASAITTRGFGTSECNWLVDRISSVLGDIENQENIDTVRREVIELCNRFPVYKEA